jgi:5-methylcytosine-specific restriction protein A
LHVTHALLSTHLFYHNVCSNLDMSPSPPIRPCLEPGCPNRATHRGRCLLHYQERRGYEDRRRGTRTERGYTNSWFRLRQRVLKRDGGVCAYCGGIADSVDHVLPKVLGGPDDMGNLVAACTTCNSRKGGRLQ